MLLEYYRSHSQEPHDTFSIKEDTTTLGEIRNWVAQYIPAGLEKEETYFLSIFANKGNEETLSYKDIKKFQNFPGSILSEQKILINRIKIDRNKQKQATVQLKSVDNINAINTLEGKPGSTGLLYQNSDLKTAVGAIQGCRFSFNDTAAIFTLNEQFTKMNDLAREKTLTSFYHGMFEDFNSLSEKGKGEIGGSFLYNYPSTSVLTTLIHTPDSFEIMTASTGDSFAILFSLSVDDVKDVKILSGVPNRDYIGRLHAGTPEPSIEPFSFKNSYNPERTFLLLTTDGLFDRFGGTSILYNKQDEDDIEEKRTPLKFTPENFKVFINQAIQQIQVSNGSLTADNLVQKFITIAFNDGSPDNITVLIKEIDLTIPNNIVLMINDGVGHHRAIPQYLATEAESKFNNIVKNIAQPKKRSIFSSTAFCSFTPPDQDQNPKNPCVLS